MDKTINDLISPEYCKINADIYNKSKRSMGGAKHAEIVMDFAMKWDAYKILDYGCGQGQLKQAIDAANAGYDVFEYDPAIIGKEALPAPAEFIVCVDVLEHIEPDKIDAVLEHIFSLMGKGGFFIISMCLTKVWLPDGRNAHILLKPVEWWLAKLNNFRDFEIRECKLRIKKHELKDIVLCIKRK